MWRIFALEYGSPLPPKKRIKGQEKIEKVTLKVFRDNIYKIFCFLTFFRFQFYISLKILMTSLPSECHWWTSYFEMWMEREGLAHLLVWIEWSINLHTSKFRRYCWCEWNRADFIIPERCPAPVIIIILWLGRYLLIFKFICSTYVRYFKFQIIQVSCYRSLLRYSLCYKLHGECHFSCQLWLDLLVNVLFSPFFLISQHFSEVIIIRCKIHYFSIILWILFFFSRTCSIMFRN